MTSTCHIGVSLYLQHDGKSQLVELHNTCILTEILLRKDSGNKVKIIKPILTLSYNYLIKTITTDTSKHKTVNTFQLLFDINNTITIETLIYSTVQEDPESIL